MTFLCLRSLWRKPSKLLTPLYCRFRTCVLCRGSSDGPLPFLQSFVLFLLNFVLVKSTWQLVGFLMEVRQFVQSFVRVLLQRHVAPSAWRCDHVSCFFTLSSHFLHSGLQAAPPRQEQSPWPVWPDWARVWKSLYWKPRLWVTVAP